jgi:pSer/pThr/pTyr-binding forkhead associated (FHA) protein/pimeloyl-ACP methyl ester carboxylesterase
MNMFIFREGYMDRHYGKLILINPNGPVQEYVLAKCKVTMGRLITNDIVLNDVRVSRTHAMLECGPNGVVLVDMGSSNGSRLNGLPVDRATLKPGDTISLGSQQLKYQVDDPSEDVGLTMKIDTQVQLEKAMVGEFLPKMVNDTSSPNLVIFTEEKTWSVDLGEQNRVTIGRDESCEVYINSHDISRRHAEVQREGDTFLLVDLNSTNGTWLGGTKIDRYCLQNGDSFRVGCAQLVFKSGFAEPALSGATERISESLERRIVIFVPGLMGSEFWLGNERVWPNVKTIFSDPEIFAYPSKVPLEPRSIVDEIVIIPGLIKQDQYNRMGDYLVEELGYQRGVDFFEFPYDWRQDVRISARQLKNLIDSLPPTKPIIIVAHSLGTMVTRYYVEHLGGNKRIEKMILMGGPHKGAVKGLVSMLVAPSVLPFGIMGERLRQVMMTFPSSYQILPNYAVGIDQVGNPVNFIEDSSWLPPDYLRLLKIGKDFRKELKPTASIPSVSIFGYGIKTISDVSIVRDPKGWLMNVEYKQKELGDGSVLQQSAFLPGSDIHPVHQHHGALFVDNDVRMRLKLELTRTF